jgi:hypothetical protein
MKNLIRLSCLLLLGAALGCAHDSSSAQTATTQPTASAVSEPEGPSAATSEEPAAATPPRAANSPAATTASRVRTPPRSLTRMQTVPAGTSFAVVMADEVSTSKSKEGDSFNGTLSEDLVVDGRVVAERGDDVIGRVDDIVMPGKVKGRAQLTLVLTNLSASGREYRIKTEPFVAIAVDNKERDAAIIAGGAGVGAAIGAITKGKKGAAIGAILGGGGGTAAVLATPGRAMKIEPETRVNFVLDNEVRLPVIRNRSS